MCFVCGQSRPFFIVANPTNGNRKFKQGDQKAGFTLVADQWNYNFDTFQTGSVGPSSAQPRVEFFIFFFYGSVTGWRTEKSLMLQIQATLKLQMLTIFTPTLTPPLCPLTALSGNTRKHSCSSSTAELHCGIEEGVSLYTSQICFLGGVRSSSSGSDCSSGRHRSLSLHRSAPGCTGLHRAAPVYTGPHDHSSNLNRAESLESD